MHESRRIPNPESQIPTLVAALNSRDAVAREAAIARLIVSGARAVERLLRLADSDADVGARVSAWRALEAIADPRALDAALRAVADRRNDAAIGAAAAGAARTFIRGRRGAAVVDALTAVVLDGERPETVRFAALDTLGDLGAAAIAPLLRSLATDPSAAIRARAAVGGDASKRRGGRKDVKAATLRGTADYASIVAAAGDGRLPEDPADLRAALNHQSGVVALPVLLRIVQRVREREGAEPPERRGDWRVARAAAHVALADRGSRLALYDLRESLESASAALPVEFFKALARVGDAASLESIAAAHAKAADAWSRQHLTDAFYAIVEREKITARSPILKRIAKRWPAWSGRPGGPGRPGGSGRPGRPGG